MPLIICLPRGLCVSGVTLWALRLASALADDRRVALIVHREGDDHAPIGAPVDRRVRVFDLRHLPPIDGAGGDLTPFIRAYRDIIGQMERDGPVAIAPNLVGDCFGTVAALAQTMPERVRVLAWQHSDIAYDRRLLTHYAPMIHRFVAVSEAIHRTLAQTLATRAGDLVRIPYGVEVPAAPPTREPLGGRPLRLVYTGRLEHPQKRIGALITLGDALTARGIAFEMRIVGDGPAASEVDDACARRPAIARIGACEPSRVREHLRWGDLFVLPSRYEGLSVSMLEALSEACVPVITRVRSGAAEAIEDGQSGVLVEPACDDERAVGEALARGVQRALALGVEAMGRGAWKRAKEAYSIEHHARAVSNMLIAVEHEGDRPWPADRPCAFTSSTGAGSGVVPEGGAARMREVLASLDGRSVVLYGAGRHTIELASVLADAPCRIVAVCDDDPAKWGGRLLGWEVIAPAQIESVDPEAVVISSHLHESEMLRRMRDLDPSMPVHALYGAMPPDEAKRTRPPAVPAASDTA